MCFIGFQGNHIHFVSTSFKQDGTQFKHVEICYLLGVSCLVKNYWSSLPSAVVTLPEHVS